ncbi:SusC/RagA family TonB-linked outer membrane protein [Chryseobacterium sp. T20]|uniref:SusC/RagA family TonB-linked outer membrane protein n=1 Tax=Chryseobacterium sp. T20 TaxID=3395375 RepID=UPI0039BCC678
MNVKLRVLSAGALFFMGAVTYAQTTKKDTTQTKQIDEVVVQGYRTVSKKTAVGASQQIKAETIESRAQSNVLNAVQGQLAGVNISAGSGQPGAKPTVIIRGVGTLSASTDPLYVIDGFPSNSDAFRNLNSYDIETFEVLKDPAALAEYGNRGSNGVIVITTKRGSSTGGKLSFHYNSQTGVNFLQKNKYNIANSRELLTLEKRLNTGKGVDMTDQEINDFNINTDWLDYFYNPGIFTAHNLSVESGNERVRTFTTAGYLNQDGTLAGTSLQRFTLRNNISGKSENKKFDYFIGMAAVFSKNSDQPSEGDAEGINQNPILGAQMGVPYLSPSMYSNGYQLFQDYASSGGSLLYTPLFLIDKVETFYRRFNDYRFDVNSELSYKILPGLVARTRTNAQLIYQRLVSVQRPESFNSLLFSPTQGVPSYLGGAYNGTEAINNNYNFSFNQLAQLGYTKSFGKHTFNLTGNMEYNMYQFQQSIQTQRGLNPKNYVPDTGQGYVTDTAANDWYVPTISNVKSRLDLLSYFGSFDYDFNKTYGIVASIRRDGTSRFGDDRKWGTFWSVGGRWNIDSESFMDNVSFVDVLKLRGSYGVIGNQRVVAGTIYQGLNPPKYYDVYTPITTAGGSYNSGFGMGIAFGDPLLQWESTKLYNVGIDFEFFNRRLTGSFDKYGKKTENMYYTDPMAPVLGTGSIDHNTNMFLYNRGYELSLNYTALKTEDLTLNIRANGSINNQELGGIAGGGYIDSGTQFIVRQQNGMLPFMPYVYHYLGVNPANGELLFEDANGNATENPTFADRKTRKYNYLPKYQGGFGFDVNYKGFYASTTFTYVAGIERFDGDWSTMYAGDNIGQFNVSRDLLDSWTPTNTGASLPSLTAANRSLDASSDRFLVDASYLRLRNAQIGYKIPKRMLDGTFLSSASIYVQGENLATWTKWRGYDAESNRNSDAANYPTAKTFTIGFDFRF